MPYAGALFLNPSSGTRLDAGERDALVETAGRERLELIEIDRELDCNRAIRERFARGMRLFIAAGGDGTIHHVVQPLMHTAAILGVLPLGTYNHFARDLGIPLDWREALDVALHGDQRAIDAARINERYFINNLSLGLYPELVRRREERGRDYPRWKARLYALYTTMRKYPHVTLRLETATRQEVIRTHVFLVSNNSYELSRFGIEASREHLDGGHLAVYWLRHLPRIRLISFALRYLAGRPHQAPAFQSFHTEQMRVQTSHRALDVGVDGEVIHIEAPLTILTAPQALTVRVPKMA